MALNERLNKFKQQQERCQNTLSSIFASQASISTPKLVPGIQPVNAALAPVKPLHPIKFSNDTERLQHINSVRKSAVGIQIKLVIELLYKVISKKSNLMQFLQLYQFSDSDLALESGHLLIANQTGVGQRMILT
jgi:hypothetical protein